ncbi:transcriptional Coactivator p15-domain-containing protein [Cantharellus anzutake]|uniref:transcriptional Coactivator p15-domain-containing protein n=1 Tax=Cantharellus anzutake TaxID=1750568 RepID=UPI0019079D88|nr:transcriptional Coactivator p15-domain-containing protein [Cantharellus anzutake]XP_038922762.1 transcriptional Coactivator p15-domain-containing protein [Cantharellus anzutake]KAF8319578.1 transcriptional Coactivator p15-domain-containing protein [Cantharellus anzutake]KAF8342123.1 transcriptional Coactivator p15-domain-containing protein [Cantharellus anzutake]
MPPSAARGKKQASNTKTQDVAGKKRKAKSEDIVNTSDPSTGDEQESPQPKKLKPDTVATSGSKVLVDAEGHSYVPIGSNRRATVSAFRGKTYVHIREFYTDASGEEKPSKKGISLTVENWGALKESTGLIDELIANHS